MARVKKEEDPQNKKPKRRKVYSGPIKDKARTMARMVQGVGMVIEKYGYAGLNLANIERELAINRKAIYTYFGTFDNLIETYLRQKDFWMFGSKYVIDKVTEDPDRIGKYDIFHLLEGQFDKLFDDVAYQRIIHWELGESNEVLRSISDKREAIGERVFNVISGEFEQAGVDIRARLALQIAGIYYLILHGKTNGSTFCGIDINEEQGRQRIKKTLKDIIYEAYLKADVDK